MSEMNSLFAFFFELSSAPCLSVAAVDRLIEQQQEAVRAHVPSLMREKNEAHAREAAEWRPPETLTRWHVRIASATEGVIPALIQSPSERLEWCNRIKERAAAFYKGGLFERASRRYKRAMLDLEMPIEWDDAGAREGGGGGGGEVEGRWTGGGEVDRRRTAGGQEADGRWT